MKRYALIAAITFAMVLCLTTMGSGAEVTLVGEVNDNFQLYADGKLYEVAQTPTGDDLVTHYISAKVEVMGTIEVRGDEKIITVRSFKVVPE